MPQTPVAPPGHCFATDLQPTHDGPPDGGVVRLPWPFAPGVASGWMAWPFDLLRAQYGLAVQLGLARRSMLDGREVERLLAGLECVTLGVLARRV